MNTTLTFQIDVYHSFIARKTIIKRMSSIYENKKNQTWKWLGLGEVDYVLPHHMLGTMKVVAL